MAALRFKDDREEHTIVNVSCGAHHSMAMTSGGRLFSWGHGEYGQHGGSNEHGTVESERRWKESAYMLDC